jgi:hypothetical protein
MTIILILALAFAALLVVWVLPKLSEYRAILGIDAQIAAAASFRERLLLRIKGSKTVIVNTVLSIVAILPELLQNFDGVDLTPVIGANWAGKVIVAMAILTTITHVIGVVSSAKAEPIRPEGQ